LWFEEEVKPRVRGKAHLIRYADDFVIGFELQEDAKRVMEVLHKRMAKYGLTLHADKTRLMPFRRPSAGQKKGKGPGTYKGTSIISESILHYFDDLDRFFAQDHAN
ncbi:unnamed protein product, partial [marine sediment metagenome]